jgi:hypothetical protein
LNSFIAIFFANGDAKILFICTFFLGYWASLVMLSAFGTSEAVSFASAFAPALHWMQFLIYQYLRIPIIANKAIYWCCISFFDSYV